MYFYFLVIEPTDWIQAICATATLALAGITAWQGARINTLTDVVAALKEQSKAAQDLLEYEVRKNLKSVQPVFAPNKISPPIKNYFTLDLKNKGQKARNVQLIAKENIKSVEMSLPKIPTVVQDALLKIIFMTIDENKPYKIEIQCESDHGELYSQMIEGVRTRYTVRLPTERGLG